ncbi:MAG: ATP-dependent zinc metalloprotease FtsH [Defluviitaleaceae bacterium]|nr:ATP-dependent zinc metalloprotease FtsH [Defluviitaleaceae bacterium]
MIPNKDKNNNDKPDNNKKRFRIINWLILLLVFSMITGVIRTYLSVSDSQQISYNRFISMVEADIVERVEQQEDRFVIRIKEDIDYEIVNSILNPEAQEVIEEEVETLPIINPIFDRLFAPAREAQSQREVRVFYTGIVYHPELTTFLLERDIDFYFNPNTSNAFMTFFFSWVLPLGFFYLLIALVMRPLIKRMGGMGGMGKSSAKLYNMEKNTGKTFDDVAGQEESKESLKEIIDFLHNPEKYTKIGAKQPKGALLVGPPGTGKTLLAKAVAGEANVSFLSISGSEFEEMYVGVGASRVRDLFKQAKQIAPCIIFIDEIDAVGKSRDAQLTGRSETEQTLNQLLAEMDGFDTSKGIIILAATNRPEVLDKALLRPGRFDRRVIVEKPDLPGRIAILEVYAKKIKLDGEVNIRQIALATSGAVGADLENMVNEAALRAVRMGRDSVKQEDLMEAVEVVVAGKEKKDRILSEKEKKLVAYHEVGHALAAALQKNSQPVQKITIVPRTMGSLGYVMTMPEDEKFLLTKAELLDTITVKMAGRVAEKLVFDTESTGASNDIEAATKMARSMVTVYGMSEEFGMMGLESVEGRYLDGRAVSMVSSVTEAKRDEEVKKILDICYQKAVILLESNMEALHNISDFLFEKENITGEEFMEILKNYRTEN